MSFQNILQGSISISIVQGNDENFLVNIPYCCRQWNTTLSSSTPVCGGFI